MELIQTITAGAGGVASIDFTSIPTTYDDLFVVTSLRASNTVAHWQNVKITFNNTTSAYTNTGLAASGEFGVAAFGNTNASEFQGLYANYALSTASTFASGQIYVPNYRVSANKTVSYESTSEHNGTEAIRAMVAGVWANNAAITSVKFEPAFAGNFLEHSSISLYGIRKFNTSTQPKATGGAISYDAVNNKWVHVFSTSGTFTPTANITCEYLVIAGGGGGGGGAFGGNQNSGGGGAGGYRSSVAGQASGGGASAELALSLTSGTNYTVTIGAGGAASGSLQVGVSGSNSVFGSITSIGGGGGGITDNGAALSGGSGGGGARFSANPNGGAGTTNQGFAGGNFSGANGETAGGGGGAGQIGQNGSGSSGNSNGGNGVASTITGTSVTRAGGGGGSRSTNVVSGGHLGGSGGGGNGSTVLGTVGINGVANTGSGGGGSYGVDQPGSRGGSGIVIVRYDA